MMGTLLKAKTWLAVNWQIALLKLGIVVSLALAIFAYGVSHGKQECADQRVKEAVTALEKAKDFVPTITAQEKNTAEKAARVTKKKEEYNEQVDKAARPDACDLSPDELRSFQSLVEG